MHVETVGSHLTVSGAVELDLDGVTAIDSGGLGVLAAAHRTAIETGHVLRVTHAGPAIRRTFSTAGPGQLPPIVPVPGCLADYHRDVA